MPRRTDRGGAPPPSGARLQMWHVVIAGVLLGSIALKLIDVLSEPVGTAPAIVVVAAAAALVAMLIRRR